MTGSGTTKKLRFWVAPAVGVIALGKAQRILRGESPRRERPNQSPVSSVGLVEELGN